MSDGHWDGVVETAGPNPLLRLAGGLAVLALLILIATTNMLYIWAIGVLGSSLLQTALIAGILYVTWLRGAATWKVIAAAIALFALVMMINLNRVRTNAAELRADLTALSQLSYDAKGNLIVPLDAEKRGPLSRIAIGMVGDVDKLIREFDQEAELAGVFALFDANRMWVNSNVLRNCGVIAKVKARIPGYKTRHLAIIDKGQGEFAALDLPPSVRTGLLAGMEKSLSQSRTDVEKIWSLHDGQIDQAAAVCTVLARRNWQSDGSRFIFSSRQDRDAFERHGDRIDALSARLDEIARGNKQRMLQSQREMRGFLNGSVASLAPLRP